MTYSNFYQGRLATAGQSTAAASDAVTPAATASFSQFLLKAVLCLAVVFVLGAWSANSQAEVAANVHFVSGLVTAAGSQAGTRELAKNDDVFSGDTIETAKNGRIQMRFTDGGLVSLMPGTTFSVDEYLYEGREDADDGSLVFGMLRGGLRTVTGSIGKVKHDQYELKTPVATLGIRGTEYVAVLNPPNTLRVHVGRGKVVITNERGELEVPEGRNAVVTLGSAPEFSDREPQYLATGPGGERDSTDGEITSDPYGLNPMAGGLLLAKGLDDFVGDPEPDPDPDALYVMAGFSSFHGDQDALWLTPSSGPVAVEFGGSGSITPVDIDAPGFDLGTLQTAYEGQANNLVWGFFTDGEGKLGGDDTLLNTTSFEPYAFGPEPGRLSGSFSYSLAGATPVLSSNLGADSGATLTQLDFGINLAELTYTLDMAITWGESSEYRLSELSGQNALVGGASGFKLENVQVQHCGLGDCGGMMDAAAEIGGFLSGPENEQAGMVYKVSTSDETLSGAAGLKRN